MHQIHVSRPRPDFRVFIDLLYGAGHDVDTDGDANAVNSRSWTELYIKDRHSDDPAVRIDADAGNPAQFRVQSASARLEQLAALYLFLYCGDSLAADGAELDETAIATLKLRYAAELQRAEAAVWHQSSDERPYPNQ